MISIPPFRYAFDEADAAFIGEHVEALLSRGDFLTLGRYNEEFEAAFAAAHDLPHAVAVSSGTAALEILLQAADVGGRKVIVPSNTFGATPVAVIRAGGIPVLAECGADFSLDVDHAASLIDSSVAAIVVVHIGGMVSAHLPRLQTLCERHGIALIEDAAHATGASLAGRSVGAWGRGGAFSFFSTKVITCSEGGMILTRHREVAELARVLRDHAKRVDGAMDRIGYNWRMSEVHALIGLVQMRKLDRILDQRRTVAAAYTERVRGLPGVTVLEPPPGAIWNFYKLILQIPAGTRAAVRDRLADRGVALGGEVYAIPCHRQAAFAPYSEGRYPSTDAICDGHICPPILPQMSADEQDYAADALRDVLEEVVASPAIPPDRPRP